MFITPPLEQKPELIKVLTRAVRAAIDICPIRYIPDNTEATINSNPFHDAIMDRFLNYRKRPEFKEDGKDLEIFENFSREIFHIIYTSRRKGNSLGQAA